jgi:hypothetical protein
MAAATSKTATIISAGPQLPRTSCSTPYKLGPKAVTSWMPHEATPKIVPKYETSGSVEAAPQLALDRRKRLQRHRWNRRPLCRDIRYKSARSWRAGPAGPLFANAATSDLVRGKKPEVKSGEAVANFLRCARSEAEPLGHHRQTATQLPVALFKMISNFAAFKRSEHRIGNSSPGHSLPLLQFVDFAT